MKKIITFMSLIALTATSHAAYIQWSINSDFPIKDLANNDIPASLPIYLIEMSYAGSIVDAIMGGTFSASTAGVIDSASTVPPDQNFPMVTSPNSSYIDGGTEYNFAVLVFATFGGEDYYQISDSRPGFAATSAADAGLANFSPSRFHSENWVLIPEPASALLGLAGIGLLIAQKRKRA